MPFVILSNKTERCTIQFKLFAWVNFMLCNFHRVCGNWFYFTLAVFGCGVEHPAVCLSFIYIYIYIILLYRKTSGC